jgi:hypothetical protein
MNRLGVAFGLGRVLVYPDKSFMEGTPGKRQVFEAKTG